MKYKKYDLSEDEFKRLEEIYKLFGSIPRLKILFYLSDGEKKASDISKIANLTPSGASHQLSDLRRSKIIKQRKEGLNVYYSLDDTHIADLLEVALVHIKHT